MRNKLPLFQFNETDYKEILIQYEQTEESIREYLEIVKNWMKEQPHLPVVLCDQQIISFLFLNKFSVEKCKKAIDMSFTVRTLLPEFYSNGIPSYPGVKNTFKIVHFFSFPKLGKGQRRVVYFGIRNINHDSFDFDDFSTTSLMFAELRAVFDMCGGDEFLINHKDVSLSILKKFGPTEFRKMMLVAEEVYSLRISGIHIVNTFPAVQGVINLFKSFLKPKLRERFHFYKDYESLQEYFPPEILPVELGGTEKSLEELNEEWFEAMQQKDEFFKERLAWKVNENLRPEKLVNDEILGFHGNFKKLQVD